jgi:hypothetical protein
MRQHTTGSILVLVIGAGVGTALYVFREPASPAEILDPLIAIVGVLVTGWVSLGALQITRLDPQRQALYVEQVHAGSEIAGAFANLYDAVLEIVKDPGDLHYAKELESRAGELKAMTRKYALLLPRDITERLAALYAFVRDHSEELIRDPAHSNPERFRDNVSIDGMGLLLAMRSYLGIDRLTKEIFELVYFK